MSLRRLRTEVVRSFALRQGDGDHETGYLTPPSWLVGTVMTVLLLSSPAGAQDKVPSAVNQEILIKASVMTLNDENVTGKYDVLHAKLAKPFREQFSPERLKQTFKPFADKKIDWEVVVAKSPIATTAAEIDQRGALLLRGHFDVPPTFASSTTSTSYNRKASGSRSSSTSMFNLRAKSDESIRSNGDNAMSMPASTQSAPPRAMDTWRKVLAVVLDSYSCLRSRVMRSAT